MLPYPVIATAARVRPMATTKRSSSVEKQRESNGFLWRTQMEVFFRISTPSFVPTVVAERIVGGQLDVRMGSGQCNCRWPRVLKGQLLRFIENAVRRVACLFVQEGTKSML